jgi:peptidoglycan/xylan/chitin deacetylase (PgdA/CDA1 family)
LDDALGTAARAAATSSRPRAVITFDDAYRGAVLAGVSELRRRKLPATIFVPPAFIDGGDFWWDVLTPRGAAGLDDAVRDHALAACAGQDATVRAWARQQNMSLTPSPRHMTCASEAELRAAVTETRITLGAHSWSHPNLTRLDAATLTRELREPYAWLMQRFPQHTVAAISYPYGCVDATVRAATRDAGLTGFLITGGFTTLAPADRTAVPRLNIPAGVSRNGFVMRAAGLLSD